MTKRFLNVVARPAAFLLTVGMLFYCAWVSYEKNLPCTATFIFLPIAMIGIPVRSWIKSRPDAEADLSSLLDGQDH